MTAIARWMVPLLVSALSLTAEAQSSDWDAAREDLSQQDAPDEGVDPGGIDPSQAQGEDEDEDDSGGSLLDTGDPEGGGQLALWAEVATFAGNTARRGDPTTAFAVSPLLGAAYTITSRARVGAQWGFTYAHHDGFAVSGLGADSTFRLGNPLLSADLLGARGGLRYRFGVGVALPVASGTSQTKDLGNGLAMAMRGGYHPWLWMPQRLSLVGTLRVESDLGEDFVVGGDGALGLLIATGSSGNTNLALELGGDAEYHAAGPLFVGVRLTMEFYADLAPAALPTQDDNLQFALMPYARFLFGRAFVTAGFEMNLDSPFGSSFSDDGVWGLRVGAGVVL